MESSGAASQFWSFHFRLMASGHFHVGLSSLHLLGRRVTGTPVIAPEVELEGCWEHRLMDCRVEGGNTLQPSLQGPSQDTLAPSNHSVDQPYVIIRLGLWFLHHQTAIALSSSSVWHLPQSQLTLILFCSIFGRALTILSPLLSSYKSKEVVFLSSSRTMSFLLWGNTKDSYGSWYSLRLHCHYIQSLCRNITFKSSGNSWNRTKNFSFYNNSIMISRNSVFSK